MRTAVLALLGAVYAPTVDAQAAQQHILDAGINLGWATGVVEGDRGVNAANATEVGEHLARAAAHIAAFRAMVSNPPYNPQTFQNVEREINRLASQIGGMSSGRATQALYQIRSRFRTALSVILSARTGRVQRRGNCDSALSDVGFYFGQGQTLAQRGNTAQARRARDYIRRAIDAGEHSAQSVPCRFDAAGLRAMPMIANPEDPAAFARSLPVAQRVANGGAPVAAPTPTPPTATPPTAAPPTAAPPTAAPERATNVRPDFSCGWQSTYGTIRFDEGYYGGSRNKQLRGSLRREGGQWVWRGEWIQGSRRGSVVFRFESGTRFRGEWTEPAREREGGWSGSSTCGSR